MVDNSRQRTVLWNWESQTATARLRWPDVEPPLLPPLPGSASNIPYICAVLHCAAGRCNLEVFARALAPGETRIALDLTTLQGKRRLLRGSAWAAAAAGGGVGGMWREVVAGQGLYDPQDPWDNPPGDLIVQVGGLICGWVGGWAGAAVGECCWQVAWRAWRRQWGWHCHPGALRVGWGRCCWLHPFTDLPSADPSSPLLPPLAFFLSPLHSTQNRCATPASSWAGPTCRAACGRGRCTCWARRQTPWPAHWWAAACRRRSPTA